jgi:hypothetical protein
MLDAIEKRQLMATRQGRLDQMPADKYHTAQYQNLYALLS